jgi:hypothetical protein
MPMASRSLSAISLWRNFFNERLTMDQRDDDDLMLEINGRIKALNRRSDEG